MLAQGEEVDVLDHDHLVVVLDEEGVVEDGVDVQMVPGGQVTEGLLHALGRAVQPLAPDVLAQLLEQLLDEGRDHRASPVHSNRFLAVSTTATRASAAAGNRGASRSQNARARPSPVVITPASRSTASRL